MCVIPPPGGSERGVDGDEPGAVRPRVYEAWKGSNIFFLGGTLIFGPDVRSLFLTIFLIVVAPVSIFCVFIARKLMDYFSNHYGISIMVVSVVFTAHDLCLLLLTSGRDPGIVPRNPHPPEPEVYGGRADAGADQTPQLWIPRVKDVVVNGITVKIKYCDTCMLYRLLDALTVLSAITVWSTLIITVELTGILGNWVMFAGFSLLLLTSGRDAGIVPRNPRPPEPEVYDGPADAGAGQTPQLQIPCVKDVVVNGITVKIKYCDMCMLYRPPQCSHCSVCNNCVERFDHHCPWVGQCIGENYRFFFMFVFSTTLLCIYVFGFCWVYIKRFLGSEENNLEGNDGNASFHRSYYLHFYMPLVCWTFCVSSVSHRHPSDNL